MSKIPLDTVICTCREVTLGEILYAIKEQSKDTIDGICELTDAGVCCKSCITKDNEVRLLSEPLPYIDVILNKLKKINRQHLLSIYLYLYPLSRL